MQKTPSQKFKIFFACYTRRVVVIFITLLCHSILFALYSRFEWHGFLWNLAFLVDWYLLAVIVLVPVVYRDCARQSYELTDTWKDPWNWSFQFSTELRVVLVFLVVWELMPWSTPITVLNTLSTLYKRWFCFAILPNIFFFIIGAVNIHHALTSFSLMHDTEQVAVKKLASPIRNACLALLLVIFFWTAELCVGSFNTRILCCTAGVSWWRAGVKAGEPYGYLAAPDVWLLCDRIVQIFSMLQFILIFEAVCACWRWVRLYRRVHNGGKPTTANAQHMIAEFSSIKLIVITLWALFLGCVWTDIWVWVHLFLWTPPGPLPPT